jgi:hypothetical protein
MLVVFPSHRTFTTHTLLLRDDGCGDRISNWFPDNFTRPLDYKRREVECVLDLLAYMATCFFLPHLLPGSATVRSAATRYSMCTVPRNRSFHIRAPPSQYHLDVEPRAFRSLNT